MTWRDLVLIAGHCSGFYERGNTTKLPKAEHATAEWQAAMESLILVQSARIGVMRALNRHVEREFNPDRKDPHWGKRKVKRDS
jgi:predicted lipoprotein